MGMPLRVSALLSAPRCDTTQLLFIPIRLAPIWVIHSGYADPRPRPKCTPQCLLGRRTRKMAFFVCSLVFLYLSLILFTLLWKQSPVSFGQSSYPSGSCYSINAFNYVETSQRLSTPCWPSAISRCLRISHTPPDSVILFLNLRRVRSSHLLTF